MKKAVSLRPCISAKGEGAPERSSFVAGGLSRRWEAEANGWYNEVDEVWVVQSLTVLEHEKRRRCRVLWGSRGLSCP